MILNIIKCCCILVCISFQKDVKNVIKDPFNCLENVEIHFFKTHGKVERTNDRTLVCTFEDDSIKMRSMFLDCKIAVRSISSKVNRSQSFAKFKDDLLITFDSLDRAGNHVLSYVIGTSPLDKNKLPEYLKASTGDSAR